ncbi:MAG: hypothetical protein HPY83_15285 [Anaerolineae bacterium]|nr:hypothetical protein [Anaerolineae bacterium]
MGEPKGLYDKYRVRKTDTGEELEGDYFVLRPGRDPAARKALAAYAEAVRPTNEVLARDLDEWLSRLK